VERLRPYVTPYDSVLAGLYRTPNFVIQKASQSRLVAIHQHTYSVEVLKGVGRPPACLSRPLTPGAGSNVAEVVTLAHMGSKLYTNNNFLILVILLKNQ
jgi:hypothetical protein